MTVTAEQAKALLDAAATDCDPDDLFPWTFSDADDDRYGAIYSPNNVMPDGTAHPYWGIAYEVFVNHGPLLAAAPDLAATVVELEAERDKLARWKGEAMTVLAGWNQLWEDAGRPGALGESTSAATAKHINALQAAIDKVLALHLSHDDICEHCGWGYWPCPTVQALTQGGDNG